MFTPPHTPREKRMEYSWTSPIDKIRVKRSRVDDRMKSLQMLKLWDQIVELEEGVKKYIQPKVPICPECEEEYSLERRQNILEKCDHTICSTCLHERKGGLLSCKACGVLSDLSLVIPIDNVYMGSKYRKNLAYVNPDVTLEDLIDEYKRS